MAHWFYYDNNGTRRGPVNSEQLKSLAQSRAILPETLIENSVGQGRKASEISGLASLFGTAPVPPEPTETYGLSSAFNATPIPAPPEPVVLPPPPVSFPPASVSVPEAMPLNRTVFVFLAVFVGIFGVHDFFAKRIRDGFIHIALMLPWILAFLASVFFVFGYSLYILSDTSLNKEIRECKNSIKQCGQDLLMLEQKKALLEQELAEAEKGIITEKEPEKEGGRMSVIIDTPKQEPVVGRQDESPKEPPETPEKPGRIPFDPRVINKELVRRLEVELKQVKEALGELKRQLAALQAGLEVLQAAQQAKFWLAGASTIPLWLYFFFGALPVFSWIMAMFEIVYVTRDGTGREMTF